MPELDLVFDFDGWKLGGIYIFSPPAAFAFFGVEDTPPTETTLQPNLLERLAAGVTGRKLESKRRISDDQALVFSRLGLSLEYDVVRIFEFEIQVQKDEVLEVSAFPGRFVFGIDKLDLSPTTTIQNVKDLFGTPNDEDPDLDFISYNIQDYELTFWFDDKHNLERIVGFWDYIATEETEA